MMNIKDVLTIAVAVLIGAGIFYARGQGTAPQYTVAVNDNQPRITVYKTEFFGCYLDWVEHVIATGLAVEVKNVASTISIHDRLGVRHKIASCHTSEIDGYWIDGHVPADLIQELVSERPARLRGLAAPGLPMGPPGMGGPTPVQYGIIVHHADGATSVYARRKGQVQAE